MLVRAACSPIKAQTHLRRALATASPSVTQDMMGTIAKTSDRPRLLLLGSGWAGTSMLKRLNKGIFDVYVVSPQNYFLFTPLLPEATTGTVEARSLLESMRRICDKRKAHYLEASALDIDVDQKQVLCQSADGANFRMSYDLCVISVGATSNSFGVKGVIENTHFLKTISDARKIRHEIGATLEAASLPDVSEQEKKKLLSFVIAGGGPTGVEFAAELSDFLVEDIRRLFPELAPYVQITIVDLADHILNTMSARLSEYAEKRFKRQNIRVLTKTKVVEVKPNVLLYKPRDADPEEPPQELPFGVAVWATGIGMREFTQSLARKLQQQKHAKSIIVDSRLRVVGGNSLYAMGDCATIENPALLNVVTDYVHKKGQSTLTYQEFDKIARDLVQEYPILELHLKKLYEMFDKYDHDKQGRLTDTRITEMLSEVDKKLTSFPATAQVASQEGTYLARHLNKMASTGISPSNVTEWKEKENTLPPFKYKHLGTFSYIGRQTSILDLGKNDQGLGGWAVFWLWRGAYLSRQVSLRTRALLALDWTKAFLFGRDVSRF
ncbi:hypothetical protein SeMB42_g01833 [Synchytrium endobioticum]|uniref:Uncharacterized protein n=1 Tax=Synchytrium endobioticum TaxID=286115 RepID=A0A507DJ75_9FUNG|nr:hypothetical protein SeLEV6574_g00431 [Synchytrium endobioticum]TPX51674.1 hypothetical protein SeMB42_g01833 [Synchytrium endobioticum]